MIEFVLNIPRNRVIHNLTRKPAFTARIVESADELLAVREAWQSVVGKTARTTVFQSWEWCFAWWQSFGADYARLAVTMIYDHADLVMILPFCAQNMPDSNMLLRPLAHNVSDYVDCLLTAGYEPFLGSALLAVMKRLNARVFKTGYTASWSSLHQAIGALKTNANIDIAQPWMPERCPAIVLPDTWEAYYASRTTKSRKNIRHVHNQFQASGLDSAYHRQPDRELIAEVIALHQRWMTYRQLVTVYRDERSAGFLQLAITHLAQMDQVRLFTIRDNSILVAFDMVLKDKNWYYAYISGIDHAYLNESPGVINLVKIIRAAIDERQYGVDLMLGDEAYKFKWANTEASTVMYELTNIGMMAGVIRRARNKFQLRSRVKSAATAIRGKIRQHTPNGNEPAR